MEVEQPDQITRTTSEKSVTSPVKKTKKKVQIFNEQEENSEKNLPPEVPPLEDSPIVSNKNSETPTSEKSPTVSPQNIEKREKKEKKEERGKAHVAFGLREDAGEAAERGFHVEDGPVQADVRVARLRHPCAVVVVIVVVSSAENNHNEQ